MKRIILTVICLVVIFTANSNANLIIYDSGGSTGIAAAMDDLGFAVTDYEVRNAATPVTAADLASASALIIGWNENGDMSGLSASVLDAGIKGNILITGHDADWHTVYGYDAGAADPGDAVEAAATLFLSQAIAFAQEQGGTGLVALGDFSGGFSYLPSSWGIVATYGFAGTGDELISITAAGAASGVYDGLAGSDMSPWMNSYHNEFTAFDSRFEVFENHHTVETPITIGYVVPVPGALLLGMLGLSAAGIKLRKFA